MIFILRTEIVIAIFKIFFLSILEQEEYEITAMTTRRRWYDATTVFHPSTHRCP